MMKWGEEARFHSAAAGEEEKMAIAATAMNGAIRNSGNTPLGFGKRIQGCNGDAVNR